MANKESNHSTSKRTMLWIIVPGAIFVSLLFTRLNHKMTPLPPVLKTDYSQTKVEKVTEPAHKQDTTMENHSVAAPEAHPVMQDHSNADAEKHVEKH